MTTNPKEAETVIHLSSVRDIPKTLEDSSTFRRPTLVRTINGRSFHPVTGTPVKTTTKQEEREQVKRINKSLRQMMPAKRPPLWPWILAGIAIGGAVSYFLIRGH